MQDFNNQLAQLTQAPTEQQTDNTQLAQNQMTAPPGGRINSPAQGQQPDSTVTIPDGNGEEALIELMALMDAPLKTSIKVIDHGAGDPHAHDWDWSKNPPRQPGRMLTPEEQEKINNGVEKATFWGTVGVVSYWVVSEASRILFPPRNLIPIP